MRKYIFIPVLMAVLAIGCENETASSGNKIPGGNNQTPGGNNQNPGGNNQNPGGNNQNPGGNNQNPGGNNQGPDDGCKNSCPGNQQCGANKVCCDSLCGENCCVEGEVCGSNKACCRHLCGGACCGKDQLCTGNVCCDENKRCGNSCCAGDEICDKSLTCGKPETLCGNVFCKGDQVCINAKCRVPCETDNRCTLSDGTEVCCGKDGKNKNKICVNQQCQALTVECNEDFICENDQYCNTELGYCVEQPKGNPCQAALTGSELIPELKWHWGKNPDTDTKGVCKNNVSVMSAPMVADLDKDGIPEVVFTTYGAAYTEDGVIRVVDGKKGELKATFPEGLTGDNCRAVKGTGQVAIGDLDADGYPDIVACNTDTNSLVAFSYKKRTRLWLSPAQTKPYCGQSGPGIADFDGDGSPEVYVGFTVVNGQNGDVIYHEACGNRLSPYYHNFCEYNVAADLDGDNLPELIGGDKALKYVGGDKKFELYKESPKDKDNIRVEGYVGVADIDLDGKPNVVVVGYNELYLLDENYNLMSQADTKYASGPPNIANIDDTKELEITFASSKDYRAFAYNPAKKVLSQKWAKLTKDETSQKTGASIFDFDGDGQAEAVYADEDWLRIYNGKDGSTKYCLRNSSATHWEYPVIADVDADGKSEIAICSNPFGIDLSRYRPENSSNENYRGDSCITEYLAAGKPTESTRGVRVFAGPGKGWVPTRQIWNQHAYYVTNVNKDGTIPKRIIPNWSRKILNNFRLNVEPGATYLPNFDVEDVRISEFYCADTVTLYVTVTNKGWAPNKVPVLLRVTMKNEDGSDPIDKDINIDDTLMPNDSKELEFQFKRGDRQIKQFSVTVNPANTIVECSTENNQKTLDYVCVPNIN